LIFIQKVNVHGDYIDLLRSHAFVGPVLLGYDIPEMIILATGNALGISGDKTICKRLRSRTGILRPTQRHVEGRIVALE
jgi:hypothetical protein